MQLGNISATGAFLTCLMTLALGQWAWSVDPTFKETLMGDTGGGGQGQTTMLDVDLDGDLDWLVNNKSTQIFFEFKGKEASPMWVMHKVGEGSGCETSGKAFDITGDNYPDAISGAVWFENPGEGKDITGPWTKHTNNGVPGKQGDGCADAALGDWNHDGRLDFARVEDAPSAWYEIPAANPRGPWNENIWPDVEIHSGLAAGDFNGDGWLDAIVAKTVFLNLNAQGTSWDNSTELPVGADNCLVEAGDIDQDGDMDVIHQKHWGGSDNVWVENIDGTGKNWTQHVVGSNDTRGHSANIADIDNDGDIDFELGEDGGDSKWYLNNGDKTFKELVFTSHPTHDYRVGDVDQDGDLDGVAKPWGGGEHKYIENLLVDTGGPESDPRTRYRGPMGSHNPTNPNRPKKDGCMIPGDPSYDFWAYHDGPIEQFCAATSIFPTVSKASARQTWGLSFVNQALEPGLQTYRVDGSHIVATETLQSRVGMVLLKKHRVGGHE